MFLMVASFLISCEYLISITSTLASLFFLISDEGRDLCMADVLIGNGSGHTSAGEPSCCTGVVVVMVGIMLVLLVLVLVVVVVVGILLL